MSLRRAWRGLALALLLRARLAAAQELQPPLPIAINSSVSGELTPSVGFTWYRFQAQAGQSYRVQMLTQPGEALQPRLGLSLDGGATLALRSDAPGPGVTSADGLAALDWQAPADVLVTLVAGAREGTLGAYRLSVQQVAGASTAADAPAVSFGCRGEEAVVLAALQLASEAEAEDAPGIAVAIYGTGDLRPALRVQAPQAGIDLCWTSADDAVGDAVVFPDGEALEIGSGNAGQALLFNIVRAPGLGDLTLTLGALGESRGRYLALLQGGAIAPRGDQDVLRVRRGPRADGPLQLYMLATGDNTRLDPRVTLQSAEGAVLAVCDDAGARACPQLAPADALRVQQAGVPVVQGGRFDGGAALPEALREWGVLLLEGFNGGTSGAYALALIGAR